jgi:hypothetical protein
VLDTTLPTPVPPPGDESLALTGCRLFCRSQIAHLDQPVPWLWHGYVARYHLTLLTGQWKIGKTTLLAALLARLGDGGELAGRPVTPGRAVVITEEGAGLWLKRLAKHGIGDWVRFAFNPFVRKPLPRQWQYLLDDLAALHRDRRIDLVVIDPLAVVLPGREEASAAAMTDALRPVRALAAGGPGVLLLHHPRKGYALGGQGARGRCRRSSISCWRGTGRRRARTAAGGCWRGRGTRRRRGACWSSCRRTAGITRRSR